MNKPRSNRLILLLAALGILAAFFGMQKGGQLASWLGVDKPSKYPALGQALPTTTSAPIATNRPANLGGFISQKKQALIFVDHSWLGLLPGAQLEPQITYLTSAFASIQAGLQHTGDGGQVRVAGGTYTENIVLNRPVTLTLTTSTEINGDVLISAGSFQSPTSTLTLNGGLLHSGGTFMPPGQALLFLRPGAYALTLAVPTHLGKVLIGRDVVLVETRPEENAIGQLVLSDGGAIRKSLPVQEPGPYNFGLAMAAVLIDNPGRLDSLEVERRGGLADHLDKLPLGSLSLPFNYLLGPSQAMEIKAHICLGYTPAELAAVPGVDEARLQLCRWDGIKWQCEKRSSVSEPAAGRVCAEQSVPEGVWIISSPPPISSTYLPIIKK